MAIEFEIPNIETLKSSFDVVKMDGGYEILANSPLPEFKTPGATAYQVKSPDNVNKFFAFVSDSGFPVNFSQINTLYNLNRDAAFNIIKSGPVKWLADNTHQFAIIMKYPQGKRIVLNRNDTFKPFTINEIEKFLVRPILSFLTDLQESGAYFGGIRPDNLYFFENDKGRVILGEPFMLPDLFAQDPLFMSVDKASCTYSGRGKGNISDDIYALGLTIVSLLAGRVPLSELSHDEVLRIKIERGTFSTFTRVAGLPATINELLRGLLADDEESRWNLDEIQSWFAGNRQSVRQAVRISKAARLFEFDSIQYSDAKSIAISFAENPQSAIKCIETDNVLNWFKRSFTDQKIFEGVNDILNDEELGKMKLDSARLSFLCMALDSSLPIFYKQLGFLPSGLGTLLMDLFVLNKNPALILEIVRGRLLQKWSTLQNPTNPQNLIATQTLDMMFKFAEKKQIGLGIERVLYELNHSLYCLSPKVIAYKPRTLPQIIQALEHLAQSRDFETEILDHHIFAFILVHNRNIDNYYIGKLESDRETGEGGVATAYILGDLLKRNNDATPYPFLAEWVVSKLNSYVEKLHNTELKEVLAGRLADFAKKGDLIGIADLIRTENMIEEDQTGYDLALRKYNELNTSIEALNAIIDNPSAIIKTIGRHVASAVSTLCATVVGIMIIVKIITTG